MTTLQLIPFGETHLDDATVLLAARQRRDRLRVPALPPRYTEPEGARAALLTAWHEPQAYGVAAVRDGQLVGFLIAAPDLAEIWGRSVWIRYSGHALARTEGADLYRDLYAALAPHWLARGCFAHYIELPADDRPALDAWSALSFGWQQAYALRDFSAAEPPPRQLDPSITIRRAVPFDLDVVVEMQRILFDHLGQSPVFSVRLPETYPTWPAKFTEALANPEAAIWLAERDGRTLGAVEYVPLPTDDAALDVPERCCYLALAATRAEERGRGISTALALHGLQEARNSGYTACMTDWRTANLPSSRLWPRLGFRPFEYRLTRLIDDRIAWAHGPDGAP